MGRAFKYVVLGGGTAAGYAAQEFVRGGVGRGELCIISEEDVAPYERPALSKGYLMPDSPARLPSFHTCVGAGAERHTAKWYKENGIELLLGTRVVEVQVSRKTLTTAAGETITYQTLIIATGARALRLEEFGVKGADCERVCYLRDLKDAEHLVKAMRECKQERKGGGRPTAVVIGGGYIGMEATAALVANSIDVTMVFPEAHCMARLFTPEIAEVYEAVYRSRGVRFVKGSVIVGLEKSPNSNKVQAVVLKDRSRVAADMVVVGVGICPNTSLFDSQLAMERGGIRVNGRMRSVSNSSVYAVGDAAAFPLRLYSGAVRRMEHVDHARRSAAAAVAAILGLPLQPPRGSAALPGAGQQKQTAGGVEQYDYLPYFYSRVFKLSWQFFGDNTGQCILFRHYIPPGLLSGAPTTSSSSGGLAGGPSDASAPTQQQSGQVGKEEQAASGSTNGTAGSQGTEPTHHALKFGAYFVDKGRLMGAFLEGGTKDEYAAMAAAARSQPRVPYDAAMLASMGTQFVLDWQRSLQISEACGAKEGPAGSAAVKGKGILSSSCSVGASSVETAAESGWLPPATTLQAGAGIAVAVGIVVLAYWHGRHWRKRWQ